jgi:hypothetical protein
MVIIIYNINIVITNMIMLILIHCNIIQRSNKHDNIDLMLVLISKSLYYKELVFLKYKLIYKSIIQISIIIIIV